MNMKKHIFIITAILLLISVTATFIGCDLARKLTGAEVKFPERVAGAEQLSFDMALTYECEGESTVIDLSCFKRNSEYAYSYASSGSITGYTYLNLYADEKLYETVKTNLNVGSYHVKNNVQTNDEGNLLYWVSKNILALTVAAMVTKAHKETLNGETVYRYDISLKGNNYQFWYNSSVLVQLKAFYEKKKGDDTTVQETYTAVFSNYKFKEVETDPFVRPQDRGGLYTESAISFEEWVSILGNFTTLIASAQ